MHKIRLVLLIITLLLGVFVGVRKTLEAKDNKVYNEMYNAIITNDINLESILEDKDKYNQVLHIKKKSYKDSNKLIIYLNDIEPSAAKIWGQVKKGKEVYDFELYGPLNSTQTLNVGTDTMTGEYMRTHYRGFSLDLGGTDYTFVNAECLLLGK